MRSSTSKQAISVLAQFSHRHRALLGRGVLATFVLVGFRIALPWPLKTVLDVVFAGPVVQPHAVISWLPARGDAVLWLGLFYLLIALGSGFAEMLQRAQCVRFASRTMHDLRAAAIRHSAAQKPGNRMSGPEMVAWTVGVAARIKSGLAGVLIHGLRSGILFAGIVAVLLYVSPLLGAILAVSGIVVLLLGLRTAMWAAPRAVSHSRKEGLRAIKVHAAMQRAGAAIDVGDSSDEPGSADGAGTDRIGFMTVAGHGVLAASIAAAMWVGTGQVRDGTLLPGDLFLFVAYATTVHRSMVKLGQRAARAGTLLGCLESMVEILTETRPAALSKPAVLHSELHLQGVKLLSSHDVKSRPRLRRADLKFKAGERVALLGPAGSGKSSLLQVVCGEELPDKGRTLWDGEAVKVETLATAVSYLPQETSGAILDLRALQALLNSGPLNEQQWAIVSRLGAGALIRQWASHPGEELSPHLLSRSEARVLGLASILLCSESPVWALDDPLAGLTTRKAEKRLDAILCGSSGRTVFVALSRAVSLEAFDRLIYIRKGRVAFDGKPADWKLKRTHEREGTPPRERQADNDTIPITSEPENTL